jgi:hypothetical protein
MRRVNCKQCGVLVEEVPWGMGNHSSTKVHMHFLGHWARKLSWKETAEEFRTSWIRSTTRWRIWSPGGWSIASWGPFAPLGAAKGTKYMTLVYQVDLGCTRLLWMGKERTVKTFTEFFTMIGPEVSAKIEFVYSDMWKPYLGVIREKCAHALNILDRFRPDQIPLVPSQPAGESHRQPEDFQQLWNYEWTAWAAKFLDQWCGQVMRSRIEPMKKVARTLRAHRELNYFRARKEFSSGVIEGLNSKAKSL